jgi:hypothetical protein
MYQSIKTSLKSIVINPKTIDVIQNTVKRCNILNTDVYQFIRLYILHQFSTNQELPKLDDVFIMNVFQTISTRTDMRGRKPTTNKNLLHELKQFYKLHYEPLRNGVLSEQIDNLSFIIPYSVTDIHTAIHNNIKFKFRNHLAKYIKNNASHNFDTKEKRYQIGKIINDLLQFNEVYKSDSIYHNWINTTYIQASA